MENCARTASDAVPRPPNAPGCAARRALLVVLGGSVLAACSTLPPPAVDGLPDTVRDAHDDGPAGSVSEELAREAGFLALSLIDTPYKYGGNTPQGGFDCSGLIVYVYRRAAGFSLPRTVAQLARVGLAVPASALRTGDLVLFDTSGRYSHAGIYVGGGRFVHAPSTGGTVRLDGMRARYWAQRFSGVRRV